MDIVARRFAWLSIVPLLATLACGSETPSETPVDVRSAARLQILMEGREVTGQVLTMVPSGFPRYTATVLDASGALSTTYGPAVLSASNPTAVRIDGDGSLVLLSLGTSRIVATARALSPSLDPQVLRDSVTISIVCTMEMRPGLNVTVRDALTGALATSGATLRAISGTWQDSLVVPSTYVDYTSWATAWERAGTYTVTVDRDGYLPWRRDSIIVPRDLCHVTSQTIDVRLLPR